MLTSAVSIAQGGNWTATTGEIYCVFLAIHIVQGCLGSTITRILARMQNVFVFANFAIIIATFVALPAATPKDERNSASFIFGDWENVNGWVNGFAFILCKPIFLNILVLMGSFAFARLEHWWFRFLCPHFRRSFQRGHCCALGHRQRDISRWCPRLAMPHCHHSLHGNRYRRNFDLSLRTADGDYLLPTIGQGRNPGNLVLHVRRSVCHGNESHDLLQSSDLGLLS